MKSTIYDKAGGIVTPHAMKAYYLNELMQACGCKLRSEWFNHLGSRDAQENLTAIYDALCIEYAEKSGMFAQHRCDHFWQLPKQWKDYAKNAVEADFAPIRKLFMELHPGLRPWGYVPIMLPPAGEHYRKHIRDQFELLPQFFLLPEGGIVSLDRSYYDEE
jgi:hypothetical protein